MGGFGGLEIQMVKRAKDALIRGDQTLFITLPNHKPEEYAIELGVPIGNLELKLRYLDIFSAKKLGKIFIDNNTKICIIGHASHLSTAVLARNIWKKDVALIFYQQLESGIKKRDFFHNWIYRNIDGAVVLTEIMRDTMIRDTVIDPEKVRAIPYGLDLDKLNPLKHNKIENRRKFNLPEDAFIIGLIGRIEHTKGQDIAVKAFAEANLPNSKLVICGNIAFQDYFDNCFKSADELGIKDKVIYLPFTKDVPELMNSFDVFILPSKKEAFGLVVVEAMASGLPVVGSSSGGVPEIINDGINGFLFDFPKAEQLAEKLKMLSIDQDLRSRVGAKARETAVSRYDYAIQTEKFFEFCTNAYLKRNQ
jgi:glycosyltransferase involved in cell wall biosynthesis